MPVNFLEMQRQIREMGARATEREQQLDRLTRQARQALADWGSRLDDLRGRVELASGYNSALRCAAPVDEILFQTFPRPLLPEPEVLLAADGSQVNPNRHDAVQFGVINVGAIRMARGALEAPREIVQSRLLYYEDLYSGDQPAGEEVVALMRDLGERRLLADLAAEESGLALTLTDGPLELFREPRERPQFRELFDQYLEALQRLARLNVITAGYVDRPLADLVVRLLELALLDERDLERAGHIRPLRFVSDLALFAPLLSAGERSAIFAIQSTSASKFTGVTALHFFYLNAGREGQPSFSRVEIPRWVAAQPAAVDMLHAALLAQCERMGSQPYPYILHRAHEVAVVSLDEKQRLMEMILLELRRQGVNITRGTNKQGLKNLPGKSRYSP
ncbi:MAG TPA: DNA double-strand break repair nuclease NurA [Levilinea sp.]|nr:DNA double-strand break repair nuclease NurA [Levilinea sp.]